MSDKLRAARERMRTKWTSTSKSFDEWGKPHMEYVEDLSIITDAYLAEHPADDAEPVTEEWLRSVGFVVDADDPCFMSVASEDGGRLISYMTIEPCELRLEDTCGNAIWLGDRTRGDVRHLCAALRIELGEPGGSGKS